MGDLSYKFMIFFYLLKFKVCFGQTTIVEDHVKFYCGFETIDSLQITQINDTNISSKLNVTSPVFIVIHGWTENVQREYVQNVLHDLLVHVKSNVCGMDWSTLAGKDLFTAEANSVGVGKYLGDFIMYLGEIGVSYESVTLIGHSLGAQVSAYCGEYLSGNLGTIIALDPAAPNLNDKRAQYVQCIYTAVGRFAPGAGYGHQNFFVNGGSHQPGCGIQDFFCDHHMSYRYFLYSIDRQYVFEGDGCRRNIYNMFMCFRKSTDQMGLYGDRIHGSFQLKTTASPPYACQKFVLVRYPTKVSIKLFHSRGCLE